MDPVNDECRPRLSFWCKPEELGESEDRPVLDWDLAGEEDWLGSGDLWGGDEL